MKRIEVLKEEIRELVELDELDFPSENTLIKVREDLSCYVYASGDVAYSIKNDGNCIFINTSNDIDEQIEELFSHHFSHHVGTDEDEIEYDVYFFSNLNFLYVTCEDENSSDYVMFGDYKEDVDKQDKV